MPDDSLQVIECGGDPRAMGRQQGRALRASVRDRLTQCGVDWRTRHWRATCSLRPFASGSVLGGGMGREIVRHYPHLCERIQGLAAGAEVSVPALMQLFIRASMNEISGDPLFAESEAVANCDQPEARLTRGLSNGSGAGSAWLVRRSRPDVGFASVELTLPWLMSSVAGVNEAGLSAAFAPKATPPGPRRAAVARAPSLSLLIQECLQRFESLEACVDWSLKRPASGDACLLVVDACGAAAAVDFSGRQRRVVRAHAGRLVAGGRGASLAGPHAGGASGIDESCRGGDDDWFLCLEPSQRRLRIRSRAAASETVLPVAAG